MYYPKSQIIENQITDGNTFVLKTGIPYKGYYYSTKDNKYFTGKTYTPDSKELFISTPVSTTRSNNNSLVYEGISKNLNNNNHPAFFFALPTDKDYENGIYTRYFSRRVNGSEITEIDKKQFDLIQDNVLYITIKIPWKLTGILYDDGIDKGVIDTNLRIIKDNEKVFPGLSNYLPNPTQFFK